MPFWISPVSTSALAVAVCGPFGFGRDFGAFIIGLFVVLPAIGIVLAVSGAWALLECIPRSRAIARSSFLAALALAMLIPAFWLFGDPLRDPARYAVWATLHHSDLQSARRRDGVFKHWDVWGMAGNEMDSYLASDPQTRLHAPEWAHGIVPQPVV